MNFLIYGAGGFARELAWLLDTSLTARDLQQQGTRPDLLAYITDSGTEEPIRGVPVVTPAAALSAHRDAALLIGVGDPKGRRRLAEWGTRHGWTMPPVVADSARLSADVAYGEGAVICAGSVLTCDIRLGRHVHVNLNCTIGHDSVLEDFVTLAPGVHVSGNVHIGEGAYIGTGAAIIHGTSGRPLVIGAGAVVGAQACVVRDVEPGATVVGVPAKPR